MSIDIRKPQPGATLAETAAQGPAHATSRAGYDNHPVSEISLSSQFSPFVFSNSGNFLIHFSCLVWSM
jgi:hypothetical protein